MYPKCKKCGGEMEVKDTTFKSEYDGVERIYDCEKCKLKCQATYNFEHITPDPVFWSDE